ncbi:MAG: hypothetical protein NZ481_09645 [Candidatus Kapabacteria bacterium]|nr:hypothetical protein [Candidatus Kapabacteria bacterium]
MLLCFLLVVFSATVVLKADEDVLRPRGKSIVPTTAQQHIGLVRNPWALGIEIGGSLSFFGQSITQHQAPSYQTNLTSGSGIGPFINLAVDFALTDYVGLYARLGYDQKRFTMKGYVDGPCELPIGSGNIRPTRVESTTDQTINYWVGGVGIRARFAENWLVTGGISYHSRSSASFRQVDTIVDDSGCEFLDQQGMPVGRRSEQSGSNTALFSSQRWSLDLSIGYRIPLSSDIVLVPRFGGQFFLTPLRSNDEEDFSHPVVGQIYTIRNRTLHALQLAVGLWFNL